MKGIDDMGLITKTVKIKWNGKTRKHYENLGYTWTKANEEFEVEVNHLTEGCHAKIECLCDNCEKEMMWQYCDYVKRNKDGKTYCNNCAMKLYGTKNRIKSALNNSKSFAQKLIDKHGENALELYWDYEKNTVDPWGICYNSNTEIWIKCREKDYHGSYKTNCMKALKSHGCPYCNRNGGKVHPLDSLGQYLVDNYGEDFLRKIWNDKNKISLFKVTIHSNKKYWWNCSDGKHEPYQRSCDSSVKYKFRCPECIKEREESFLEEKARLYLEELGYEVRTEYKCSIIPKNPKTNKFLPFDNEIVLGNGKHLIIEVHGGQHYDYHFYMTMKRKIKEEAEKELHYQQVKDRYKRIKCIQAGYEYLEIPYTAFDNKETYKKLINDKIISLKKE